MRTGLDGVLRRFDNDIIRHPFVPRLRRITFMDVHDLGCFVVDRHPITKPVNVKVEGGGEVGLNVELATFRKKIEYSRCGLFPPGTWRPVVTGEMLTPSRVRPTSGRISHFIPLMSIAFE